MTFNLGNTTAFPASTSSPFGFGGGTAAAATKAGFGTSGFGFGAPASAAPNFSLGGGTTSTTSSGFGFGGLTTAAAPAASGFSGFGKGFGTNPSTSTTTMTGTSGFGNFGNFGAGATTTTNTGFGFGTSFGAQPTTGGGSLFSGFNQPASSLGFGAYRGFGAVPVATSGFGGFGLGSSTLGQGVFPQQQQQQQVAPANPNETFYNSLFNCNVFGDERDGTLARWNSLQALWGTGKGYYSQNAPPIEFTDQNPFCRFKSVGYSCIPTSENKEGLVALIFNLKEDYVKTNQPSLINSLNIVLGNKPTLTITVDAIKPLSDTKTQVTIFVQEKGATGTMKRIPSTELSAFLVRSYSQNVDNIYPVIPPDKDQLAEYLENPPSGVDARLWKQAQLDNPNPSKYLPVPMIGFAEVRRRIKCQEQETKLHQAFLDRVAEDIAELQRRHSATIAKISEYRRKFAELEHRVLQVLVKQEISRKMGLALQPEEEVIQGQLDALQTQLNTPTQFKGQLSELLAHMRMQREEAMQGGAERYSMDQATQNEMKEFLLLEQGGMGQLIEMIQSDMADLKIIKDGMMQLLQGH